jgi:hypothetical protein
MNEQEKKAAVPVAKANQPKVSLEVAERDFDRFAMSMDLAFDGDLMDKESKRDYTTYKDTFVRSVQNGSLIVNQDGEPEYTCRKGDAGVIVFHEPIGAVLQASETKKTDAVVSQSYAMLGEITKQNPIVFSNMYNRDLRVCQAIQILFTLGLPPRS